MTRSFELPKGTTDQAHPIELDRLDELMRGTPVVAIGSFIGSVFVGMAFLDGAMSPGVFGWVVASCLIALGRCTFSGLYFLRIRVALGEMQPIFWLWSTTSLINGALWGVFSLIQTQTGSLPD